MQKEYQTNGVGLPNYPDDLQVKDVSVYLHDSGLIATHDYSCPVCRRNHANLNLNTGIMQPCWKCSLKGYELIKHNWFTELLFGFFK
jgi:hypothetical protein